MTLYGRKSRQKRYESKEMKNIVFILVMCIFLVTANIITFVWAVSAAATLVKQL